MLNESFFAVNTRVFHDSKNKSNKKTSELKQYQDWGGLKINYVKTEYLYTQKGFIN